MTPRTPLQISELKENKRQLILDTALRMFSENGFSGATIGMIAKEAGIAKGLLYSYFRSKEALLDELLIFGLEKIKVYMQGLPVNALDSREGFAAALRGMVQVFREEEHFWRLYCSLILQGKASEKFRNEMEEFLRDYLQAFAGYFGKRESTHPLGDAMLLGAVMDGLMFDILVMPDYPVEEVIAAIIERFA